MSYVFNKKKTIASLKKGLHLFRTMFVDLIFILFITSIIIASIPQQFLVEQFGKDAGFLSMLIASLMGSIAMMPGFISFPLAAMLLQAGVAFKVLTVFLTTLMMVGIMTLPIEIKFFGVRAALLRNGLSFIAALIIGLIIGAIL